MFKPKNQRVLIERDKVSDLTIGGIALPESVKGKAWSGKVKAISSEVKERLAIGDRVHLKQNCGVEIDEGLCVNLDDILAVED